MRAVRSLGVGAAALDDHASGPPRLDHGTGFFYRRWRYHIHALGFLIKPSNCTRKRSARIFSARLANRGAVHITRPKAELIIDALAPFRSTHALVASPVAALAASSTMFSIRHDIGAHASTRRSLCACKRQLKIPMDLVRCLIVEFSAKDPHQVHPLKVDRLGLVHIIPRYRDRVGAFLARRHKWAVTDLSRLIRKRPSDNIVYTIRVRENGGENDRFAGSNLRYIRLQAEEYWCPFHGGGCQIFASRGGFTRVTGLSRPSHCVTARICARGHGPGHRGHARCRGLIIPTASRKEPREETEVKSCSHVASVPGDADACNPGSQY